MIRGEPLFAAQAVLRRINGKFLSTNAPAASAAIERDLSKKKSAYNQQLSELRKKWAAEHQAKLDEEERRRKEARRVVVLQKAVRLRARNVVSAQNIIKDKERKAAAMARYKEHITKNNLVAQHRLEVDRAGERAALLKDLEEESSCWITSHEQADKLINESLFAAPATTGLATSTSEYWRHMAVPFNLSVMFNASFQERYGPTDASPEARLAEAMANKRLEVREMVNSMIGSGTDRQHCKEIVDKYVEMYTENDALLESEDFLDDEEEFLAEMREESGIGSVSGMGFGDQDGEEGEEEGEEEERLFQFIEKETVESSQYGGQVGVGRYKLGGAKKALDAEARQAEEEDDEEEDEDDFEEVEEVVDEGDDDDDDADDAVVAAKINRGAAPRRPTAAPIPTKAQQKVQKQQQRNAAAAAGGSTTSSSGNTLLDEDGEEKSLDMSVFDTAEESMSRELGEDVAGAAAAAAKKASTKAMQQQQAKGKAGKKGKK